MSHITQNVEHVLRLLPEGVLVVAAIKGRTTGQVAEAVAAGIGILGANYVKDARQARATFGEAVQCHFIGRLRPHDVRSGTLRLFDMIQSLGSLELAIRLNTKAAALDRVVPVLVEVNSGREPQKDGVLPEHTPDLVDAVSRLSNISIQGLMTMGPLSPDPDDYRPAFVETRRLFEAIGGQADVRATMRYLSMGMSPSYRVAVEEGANMVRLGSVLFDTPAD